MNLGNVSQNFNPIEVARNCVKNAFAPMLKDLANINTESVDPGKNGVNKHINDEQFIKGIQKKLDDIEI